MFFRIRKRLMILQVTVLIALSSNLTAQELPLRLANEYIRKSGIDTALMYNFGCNGCEFSFDTCRVDETWHLFWKKDGRYFEQKFDNCQSNAVIELGIDNPLTYYLSNSEAIRNDKIEGPLFIKRTVKKGNDKVEIVEHLSISHYNYFRLIIKMGSARIEKTVPDYYLTTLDNGKGKKNIYYESNLQTKLYALIRKIEAYINQNR